MEELEKTNIWKKISNFLKTIFDKNKKMLIDAPVENVIKTKEIPTKKVLNQYEVMNLQIAYEKGSIKENELTEIEKRNLKELYKRQIENLETNILIKEQKLQKYKEKILKVKQKISLNLND